MELSKLKPEIQDNEVKLVPKGMAKIIEDDVADDFYNEKDI